MIYVTGDTHGDLDRFKHPTFRKIKKRDTLIICGDFGFIWDGGKKEKRILKWLGKRRFNVLFVDGVHENFDELEKYEVEEWNGGKTRIISGKLRHLMRGQVFEIDNKLVFTFGGGHRDDDEKPSLGSTDVDGLPVISEDVREKAGEEEFAQGIKALEAVNYKVDYIISYEPPTKITEFLALSVSKSEHDKASHFLDEINEKAEYRRWFFGRHHLNKIITSKYFALFDNVINVDYDPASKK